MPDSTANLSILVKVKDEAAGALSRLSNETSSLGGQMNFLGDKAGMVAGALTALGSAVFLGSAIGQAREATEGWLKVKTVLDRTGASFQEVKNRAEEMSQVSTFQAHEIGFAYAKNLSLFGDSQKALEKTKLAMNLAAFAGYDLASAQNIVSKASDENIMALRRVASQLGIVVPQIDEHLDKQEQFEIILKRVKDALGDYDKKLLNADGLRQFRKQWGEFLETVGAQILPTLNNLLKNYIIPLIQRIKEWSEMHPGLFKGIMLAVGAITALVAILTPLIIVFGVVIPLITYLAGPLAILALVGVVVALGTRLLNTRGVWLDAWNAMVNLTQPIVDKIKGYINDILNAWNSLKNVLSNPIEVPGIVGEKVGGAISSVMNWVGGKLPRFAAGGIVNTPTLAMVGEAGPEMIVPLNRLAGAGGGGIVINLQGDFYTDTENASKFGKMLADEIKYQLKL